MMNSSQKMIGVQNCPICRTTNIKHVFDGINADNPLAEHIPVSYCPVCKIAVSASLLLCEQQEFSRENYKKNYYGDTSGEGALHRFAKRLFQLERQRFALKGIKPGCILDIGCGDGTFLAHLPSTWKKFGYEPSPVGLELLKRKPDIALLNLMNDSDQRISSFDVVTLWQSFEHVARPRETLKRIKSVLKETGTLVISVPNYNSVQANIFRSRWFHLDPSRHYFHYTNEAMDRLLREEGFFVERIGTFSWEYGVFGWVQSFLNLFPGEFNFFYKVLKGRTDKGRRLNLFMVNTLAALLFLPAFILLTVLEAAFSRGAVLNVRAIIKGTK